MQQIQAVIDTTALIISCAGSPSQSMQQIQTTLQHDGPNHPTPRRFQKWADYVGRGRIMASKRAGKAAWDDKVRPNRRDGTC